MMCTWCLICVYIMAGHMTGIFWHYEMSIKNYEYLRPKQPSLDSAPHMFSLGLKLEIKA